MSTPFVAEIRIFPFNFAPKGWAFCDGQILPISQNTALFSLLGTTYGGNGQSTFALPNLQGSIPLHVGRNQPGPGLSIYDLGQADGTDSVALIPSDLPAHSHSMMAINNIPQEKTPSSLNGFARSTGGAIYQNTVTGLVKLNDAAVAAVGGNLPHNNLMPYLTLNFCIALQGVFPARN